MSSLPTTTQTAFSRGYTKGREDERQQAASTISKLTKALNRALAENLALRGAAKISTP